MRDPLAPIPSPHGQTTQTHRFWERSQTIPPQPPPQTGPDPRRCLSSQEDELGIDRRSRRRHDPSGIPEETTRPVTAAQHVELDHMLGLETEHGWALMQALALSPSGILLRHFDLLAPDLDPTLRHNARQALRRVSTVLGDARTDPSPMGLVGGCVLSKRVVADLSNFANPEPIDGDRERRSSLPLRLLCPNPTVRLHGPACQAVSGSAIAIPGELAVLTDPSPEVVGVSVDAADLGRLTRALGLPALLR